MSAGETDAIRLAVVEDAAPLAALRYEFRAELAAATEPRASFERRCADWMAQRLHPMSAWRCWVASVDGGIDAMLWAQRVEKVPNPADEPEVHVYVTSFYVRAAARGRGLGARMLAVALDWCREVDADAVLLWPSARSRSLYLRHGFAVRDDVLELRLGAGVARDDASSRV